MVDVGRLRQKDAIAIASVEGAAQRLTRKPPLPQDAGKDPVAEIREITDDPVLLGIAAGTLAVYAHHADAADLVRRAGADPDVAKQQHREVLERLRRHGQDWPNVVEPPV